MFSIDTHDLPYLHSFECCNKWFKETPQSKRSEWQDNERPLSKGRMHHKRLVKNADGSYSCTLYQCKHVTYHENGMVEVRMYDSMSSRKFLDRMLPDNISLLNERGLTTLCVFTGDEYEWLKNNGLPFLFEPYGGGWKVRAGAEQRRREFVDRQKSSEVRRKIKPFLDWHKAASKVVPFWFKGRAPAHLLDQIDQPDAWPWLAEYVGDPKGFIERAYDHFDAREVKLIPNTIPPRRGRLAAFS